MGIVSLFADITYEGAKSISGQFLAFLGVSGAIVGFVAGFGELVGYSFRIISGYISDRTKQYWTITCIGYVINLLAVPLLALSGNWQTAAGLMIMERFGKAFRTPARDALLSYATRQVGRGFGFGFHEALDQIGAIMGPLLMSAVLYYKGGYQEGFIVLGIPAICALSVLWCAKRLYPKPQDFEAESSSLLTKEFTNTYWLFIAAISCIAAGYVDFPLIAYHFEKTATVSSAMIPVLFSIAMAADGVSALVFGRFYDRKGISILILVLPLASLFAPFVFTNSFPFALIGIILWGIGLGAQESIMRAVVADLVSKDRRASAYGMFNLWFGIFWFLGSSTMGILYDISVGSLVLFSVLTQCMSLPFLFQIRNVPK